MKKNFMIIFKMFRLFLILKKLKPDIIQTWMYHSDFLGGIIGRLAGVKTYFGMLPVQIMLLTKVPQNFLQG